MLQPAKALVAEEAGSGNYYAQAAERKRLEQNLVGALAVAVGNLEALMISSVPVRTPAAAKHAGDVAEVVHEDAGDVVDAVHMDDEVHVVAGGCTDVAEDEAVLVVLVLAFPPQPEGYIWADSACMHNLMGVALVAVVVVADDVVVVALD